MMLKLDGYPIGDRELEAYQRRGYEKYGDKLVGMDVKITDDGYAEISYHVEGEPFERIRRITGYLVGTVDRWNNAKRAEERDRVKHG